MGPRPTHLNLRDSNYDEPLPRPRPPFHTDLPSPRTGDVPPALSPLDAFAMQSRMLARRFEGESQNGRRISRLPHMDVEKEFGSRPGHFAGWTGVHGDESAGLADLAEEQSAPPPTQNGMEITDADARTRPISHYPMFGNAARDSQRSLNETPFFDAPETQQQQQQQQWQQPQPQPQRDYFGFAIPRASSPEAVDSNKKKRVNVAPPTPDTPSLTNSVDSVQSPFPRTTTNSSTKSHRSLAPPRSPAFPKSPKSMQSIRSVRQDSGDDDAVSTTGSHAVSSRKFSGSSNMSRPQSPLSPWTQPVHRSPSMTSELSMNGSQPPPPPQTQTQQQHQYQQYQHQHQHQHQHHHQQQRSTNFSRPMSSASSRPAADPRPSLDSRSSFETRPSIDLVAGRLSPSSSRYPSRQTSDDETQTPYASHAPDQKWRESSEYFNSANTGATSYTYTKFTLPRGRTVDRHSRGLRESWIQSQFTWDDDKPFDSAPPDQQYFTHNLDGPPRMFSDLDRPPSSGSAKLPNERQDRFSREQAMSSAQRSRSAGPRPFSFEDQQQQRRQQQQQQQQQHQQNQQQRQEQPFQIEQRNPTLTRDPVQRSSPSVRTHGTDGTDSTDGTLKPNNLHQRSASAELTAEEHLEIGIQAHSNGDLNKSTYHLRLAAKAGLPTGMLLYALACRHGWGMRPNQKDGVMWLRRAIEKAGIENADVEETLSSAAAAAAAGKNKAVADPVAEAQERKKRKAQFALAIYELGISYMNGWGCPKDKPLAVRCYEVAGSWGDCDALAEAGFCYTQGVGVKKDLKKAAGFYRKAAEGGMSMAGNSWIYKPKYIDDVSRTPEKKKDKSHHTRPETASFLKDDAAATPAAATAAAAAAAAINSNNPTDASAATREGARTPTTTTRSRARSIWGRKKE